MIVCKHLRSYSSPAIKEQEHVKSLNWILNKVFLLLVLLYIVGDTVERWMLGSTRVVPYDWLILMDRISKPRPGYACYSDLRILSWCYADHQIVASCTHWTYCICYCQLCWCGGSGYIWLKNLTRTPVFFLLWPYIMNPHCVKKVLTPVNTILED